MNEKEARDAAVDLNRVDSTDEWHAYQILSVPMEVWAVGLDETVFASREQIDDHIERSSGATATIGPGGDYSTLSAAEADRPRGFRIMADWQPPIPDFIDVMQPPVRSQHVRGGSAIDPVDANEPLEEMPDPGHSALTVVVSHNYNEVTVIMTERGGSGILRGTALVVSEEGGAATRFLRLARAMGMRVIS